MKMLLVKNCWACPHHTYRREDNGLRVLRCGILAVDVACAVDGEGPVDGTIPDICILEDAPDRDAQAEGFLDEGDYHGYSDGYHQVLKTHQSDDPDCLSH